MTIAGVEEYRKRIRPPIPPVPKKREIVGVPKRKKREKQKVIDADRVFWVYLPVAGMLLIVIFAMIIISSRNNFPEDMPELAEEWGYQECFKGRFGLITCISGTMSHTYAEWHTATGTSYYKLLSDSKIKR